MKEVVERESIATGITMEVEELQRQNQDSFRVSFNSNSSESIIDRVKEVV
jgi:hypothetical protein